MYNIQKAVSRLDFAPKLKEIKVIDIKKGIGLFTPKPDKPASFASLRDALKKAGYTLDAADITVVATLAKENVEWTIIISDSNQRFILEGANLAHLLESIPTNARVEIEGDWKTVGEGTKAREVIFPRTVKKVISEVSSGVAPNGRFSRPYLVDFVLANFTPTEAESFAGLIASSVPPAPTKPPAPIRVTSPGLTVYKGGAITPRLYLIEQHLGDLEVSREVLNLSISYTPSPRLQLEVEIPVSRTSFDDGVASGSGTGLGNVTLWSKYRFFRKVKTYGDRQAAVRFGLELPTGRSSGPSQTRINDPAFVRQQLTPIAGGFSPHFDVTFSQAGGRFIFGGNLESILRSEREGFRLGHELRLNTDTEYVLWPRKYDVPGGELFLILETSFVYRGRGRVDGFTVPGSKATEYYVAPGLQYAAHPRFVVEGSIQLPVLRNTGPLVLRNDRNILLGIKYLF